jgi:hypothetical protein
MFNQGWLCPECGPVPDSKKRSINKVQWDCCKACGAIVTRWERPLNERSGRCGNCANGSFELAVRKGRLLRKCKKCNEVVDTDEECKVKRKGDKEHAYK